MNDNIRRCLKNVVSLDGWIGSFAEEDKANVHVDVVFREALFGESADDKVTFKHALKRAEVFLVVGYQDPIKIVRSTVEKSAEATANSKLSKQGLSGRLDANAQVKASQKTTKSTEQAIKEFVVQNFTDGSTPAWEINQSDGKPMKDAPWDANDAPGLKVKHKTTTSTKEQLTVKLELRCRRQDLDIADIQFIDEQKRRRFNIGNHQTQKLVAAEQVIKDELCALGLLRKQRLKAVSTDD